jgi:dTDP-4-amino-4,6-dideoxygalactose transaminase
MQRMLEAGVSTRRGVMNAHREASYPPSSWRAAPGGLHRSEAAQRSAVLLPLYHQMTIDEQDRVIAALVGAMKL